MELRDIIVTPIFIVLTYVIAYMLRPYCTDEVNRKYFIPGLTVRILGALAVGFIYQFYYDGGDTYNFHTHGSRHVWEAFMDDPVKGFQLLFSKSEDHVGLYQYSSTIRFYKDPSSFAVIQFASVFDLLTFSTYSATAVIFAIVSFAGMWMFFLTFYRQFPHLHKRLAIASLFIPSVFFWGSGILKDTLTLACLGFSTYSFYQLAIVKRIRLSYLALLLLSIYTLYVIKIYILLTFLPAAIVWAFLDNLVRVRSKMARLILFPVVLSMAVFLGYLATLEAGKGNRKYSFDEIAKTAQVTAYDIRYWTGREAGSGYTLGELDGTWASMIRLAPQAVNVSLFRPYLWEVRNPLMLMSAVESTAFLLLTLFVLVSGRSRIYAAIKDPTVLFGLILSITFAFAVGVSTYNFGTLARYKIPLLPFYLVSLTLIHHLAKSETKASTVELTE